jgi:hypothetical protein
MDNAALVAVAGALSTVAGLLYRQLLQRAERAEAEARFWRDHWITQVGLADMALEQAERQADR